MEEGPIACSYLEASNLNSFLYAFWLDNALIASMLLSKGAVNELAGQSVSDSNSYRAL